MTASVWVGYDRSRPIMTAVFAHSIIRNATIPVTVGQLYLPMLKAAKVYHRMRLPTESTDFTFSRFLAPWLAAHAGAEWAAFFDGDMLCRGDIRRMWDLRDSRKTVQVVHHPEYVPDTHRKFGAREQTSNRRKNWSSVILFNVGKCEMLTPDYITDASPAHLHQFDWVPEGQLGELPIEWNYLVNYASKDTCRNPAVVHYTDGGPWDPGYEGVEYAEEWIREREACFS